MRVHPYKEQCCGTCKHYTHVDSRCHVDAPANHDYGRFTELDLAPCERHVTEFVFAPGTWGGYKRIEQ